LFAVKGNQMDLLSTTAELPPLLDRRRFRALLCVGEKRFEQLLQEGIVPRPLDLGPRTARWHYADFEQALQRLKRRAAIDQPEHLRALQKGSTP